MVPVTEALEMSVQEVLDLPVTVAVTVAGRAFGLNEETARRLAAAGNFPCRLIPVGKRMKAPRAAIMEVLGISEDLLKIRHPGHAEAA
jgi:hypothetical protein